MHTWSLDCAGPPFTTSVACSFTDVQEAARHVSSKLTDTGHEQRMSEHEHEREHE
jgi:hypothetical protein